MATFSIHPVAILALRTSVMTDQIWGRGFEGVLGLVFASPESDPCQVWSGLKLKVTSYEPRTIEPAFALQRPRCFLTVESTSLGMVGESGNLIKG